MIQIRPAIDIIDGKCVRLTRGSYSAKTVYSQDPVDVARSFEDAGLSHLHLVDLDGAKAAHIVNRDILEKIAKSTDLKIDFGGGLKSDADIQIAFDCGASQVTVGSIAAKQPEMFQRWIKKYGGDKVVLSADVRHGFIAVNGWEEITRIGLFAYVKDYLAKGVNTVICTDISRDGLMQGCSIDMYKQLRAQFPKMKLIASGGVNSIQEIRDLQLLGVHGVVLGKSVYEGHIKLIDLSEFII